MSKIPDGATHFVRYSDGNIGYFQKKKYCWLALIDGKSVGLNRKPPNLEPIKVIDFISKKTPKHWQESYYKAMELMK